MAELRKRQKAEVEAYDSLTDSSDSDDGVRPRQRQSKQQQEFLGMSMRFWLLLVILVSAFAVLGLCVVGEMKQYDGSYWKASEIVPRVWLGGYKDQLNRSALISHGVTHILTVAIGVEPVYPNDFQYLVIRAHDHNSQDLLSYFPIAHDFIDQALDSGGSVLIHCMAGVSRSATLTTSWLMKTRKWTAYDALDLVRKQRSRAKPRRTFHEQLEAYQYFQHEYDSPQILEYLQKWPNKAQVALWPAPPGLAERVERQEGSLPSMGDDVDVTNGSGAEQLGVGMFEAVLTSAEPIQYYDQPEWVEENTWRELWDAVVHHFLHFFNKYLRFYVKKRN